MRLVKSIIAGGVLVVFLGLVYPPPISSIKTQAIEIIIRMPKIFNPFEEAMTFLWEWEGGYVNDPADPGGATNLGVTIHTAKANKMDMDGDGDVDVDDIKNMTHEAAFALYRHQYWDKIRASDMPWDLAIAAFDAAVNCGPARAAEWARRAMGTADPVRTLNDLRRSHYGRIISVNPGLSKFKNGWYRRVNELSKYIDIIRQKVKDEEIAIRPETTQST